MNDTINHQSIIDAEHLKLLSIGYMIAAGFNALFSLLGLFYVFMGIMVGQMIRQIPAKPDEPPPALFEWVFAGIGGFVMVTLIAFAILKFLAASRIKQRRSRIFILVVAGFTCLEFPYGTAIGVMTLIVLGRESVIRLFDSAAGSQPPLPAS